ncbi:TonB-dependent receptor [Dokdonella soli]|uniref:TonB-dependent receptor n=1 Tax=Dokdonella soli TaxID=529810 RepID=A0ABN1IV19_9GAMM
MNKQLRMRLLPWVIGSLFAASAAFAQNTSSSLSGRIVDASGHPVAGATVEIVHVPSGTSRTVVTDANGRYAAQGLRVGGPFEVKASGEHGDKADQPDVYLKLAEETTLNLTVAGAAATATELAGITVTAAAPGAVFQADNKGLSTNVSKRELKLLPNPGRSIQDIARLDPNINLTNKGRGEISALGQNSRYNNITIDGVATNDSFGLEPNGLPSLNQPLSFDAIEEYNLSTANFDVTNKRAVGANINIVTKSGTNEFHGDAYYAYTNAKDLTSDEPAEFKGYNAKKTFGVTVGGPIIKDTLFFFLSYEDSKTIAPTPDYGPLGSGRGNEVNISQADLNRIIGIAKGYGMTPGDLNAANANLDSKLYLGKIDWNITEGHRASFRYNKTKSTQPILGGFNTSTLSLSSYWYTQSRNLESYVLNLYDDWNDTFSTESSFSYSKYDATPTTLAKQPQVQVRLGPNNSGTVVNLGEEQFRHYNVLSVKSLSGFFAGNWFLGDHTVKAGADFQRDEYYNLFGRTEFGAYNFASIDDFAAGKYSSYSLYQPTNGDINSIAANLRLDQWGLFVQDTWQVTPQFSLQYGLRWDLPKTPDRPRYNASFNNAFGYTNQGTVDGNGVFEPRASFNYSFDTDLKTQLRGGIGLTEGVTPGVWQANPFTNNGLTLRTYSAGNGCCFNPNPFTQKPPSGVGGNPQQTVDTVDPNLNLPTALKISLGFDRELPWWGVVATAEFAHVGVRDAIRYEAINLGPGHGLLPDGRINYWGSTDPSLWIGNNGKPVGANDPTNYRNNQRYQSNPAFGAASTYLTNTGKGAANYLTLSLQKSYSDTWFGMTSLTFGRSTEVNPGTSSQAFSNYSNTSSYNPNDNVARRSNYDIKARLLSTLTWQHRFFGDYVSSISGVYNGYTGQPYTWTFANDANGDGIRGNDVFYVPAGPNDVLFTNPTSQAQKDQFFAFINGNNYLRNHRGGVVSRNGATSPWINQIDLSFRQEVPGLFAGNKGEIRFDLFNVGNMLNKKWGQIYNPNFPFTRSLANFAGVDKATGKYIYNLTSPDSYAYSKQDDQAQSRWSVLVTLRYTF